MASRVLQSFARAAVLVGVASIALASPSQAERPVRRTTRPSAARGFNLFAGSVNVVMNVNRVQCNVNNIGESCVDPTNSPSIGGGFWPKGSPDQYIFNSGLQVAAIIPGNRANFAWSGDTVGAFFFDPRGDQAHGEGRTNVMNSLNAADIAAWPTAADVRDTSLFNAALVPASAGGTATSTLHNISQQDTWVRFWDGNTNLSNGRPHPMGLLVEQRGLMWNFPSGNQDIVYFLYRFINITTTDPAKYAGLSAFGYTAADIAEIVTIAQEFQQRSEAAFNITIPDSGYTWTNMFAAFAQDPDVGQAGSNYSNANLVFNIGMAYKSDFRENTWQFPSSIFSSPIASAPGFEGVKYLKSPQNIGIAMSGNTTNGSVFPDAVGVSRLWRNLSGNLLPTDGTCSVANPQGRKMCQWVQVASDTRFYESSGPFTMRPGESAVIVVAYIHAGPVASSPAATPGVGAVLPAFSLTPFIGGNMIPGFAVEGSRIATGADTLRNLDRAAGWMNHADLDGDGIVEQCTRDRGINPVGPSLGVGPCITEVTTTPRSLYNKALVAQAVFDAKFLLPFAPEAPPFFLIPGDNQVTVTWAKSATETVGDPYFTIASNPASVLYDPNFRKFDVEGYRIWRGRTQSEMQVIASFDYSGTTIDDYTGVFVDASYGPQCAPELGMNNSPTGTCPVAFAANPVIGVSPRVAHPLSGDVVQVYPGGRVELAPPGSPVTTRGNVLITTADTAVTGGASGLPSLTDHGVPFAYVDNTVRNGFRYFYAVTAFDINSVKSGPSSLESPLITKTVSPRIGSGQETPGVLSPLVLLGRGATPLDPTAPLPTLNATTGIFSGPMPPTNAISAGFSAFLPEVLQSGNVTITVDSVIPGEQFNSTRPAIYWFTGQGAGAPVKFSVALLGVQTSAAADRTGTGVFPATAFSTAQASRFGGDSTFSLYGSVTLRINGMYRTTNAARGLVNGDPAGGVGTGSRWWAGAANENTTDPVGNNCLSGAGTGGAAGGGPPVAFSCVLSNADLTTGRNAGAIAGVGIMNIHSYSTVGSTEPIRTGLEGLGHGVFRAADFKWYWGAAGVVDSVVDVTHNVRVPFSPKIRASWGILNAASFAGVVNKQNMPDSSITRMTWGDVVCVAPAPQYLASVGQSATNSCGGVANWPAADSGAVLQNTAALNTIVFAGSTTAGLRGLTNTTTTPTTQTGFILYINGEMFLMQMAALPAAGTVWNLRTIAGQVIGVPGSYTYAPAVRPAAVPGLRAQIAYTGSTFSAATTTDSSMNTVHTVPDPYYVTNSLEITANTKVLRFVNLPAQAVVRIYSASGVLINIVTHNDPTGGSEATWNLRNRNNQFVASGVYFYHVESPDGRKKVGRFTVVNYAQ